MASIITYRRRARKHGAHYALTIIHAARATGIPMSVAFALVEQESDFRNVFGHDPGGPFHGEKVTRAKCLELIDHVERGGVSNGVGLTQLTWSGYLYAAKKLGGLHKPLVQCIVGFQAIKQLFEQYGNWWEAYYHYNGDGDAARNYANTMKLRAAKWHDILIGGK